MIVDGLDLAAVQKFFDATVPGVCGPLHAELLHGGRSNLTYRLTDGNSSWVLRRPPLGTLTPSAHDMVREYQVVAGLGSTGVPVPRAVALGEDPSILGVPFSVVEYVPGRVIRTKDDLHTLPGAEIARCACALMDVLAELHAVDPESVGLGGFGRPEGYLARQIRRWHDQWNRVRTRTLPDIETLHVRLADICPEESGASIVHGDYRIDNCLLGKQMPPAIAAVLDWELATLGEPLADLGMFIFYWREPGDARPAMTPAPTMRPGFPSRAYLAERYANRTGADLGDLPSWVALAHFKSAAIAQGIAARVKAGAMAGQEFGDIEGEVERIAAAGLAILEERS